MSNFNKNITIITVLIAVLVAFALPATTQASTKAKTAKITTIASVSVGGSAGTSFTLVLPSGDSIKLFAPIRPMVDGKNIPVAGEIVGFKDQTCVPILGCAGEATFSQKSGKATIKIVAYRKK